MSVCELFLAVGLSFGGACEPEPVIARGLPPSDEGVFDYKLPPKTKAGGSASTTATAYHYGSSNRR